MCGWHIAKCVVSLVPDHSKFPETSKCESRQWSGIHACSDFIPLSTANLKARAVAPVSLGKSRSHPELTSVQRVCQPGAAVLGSHLPTCQHCAPGDTTLCANLVVVAIESYLSADDGPRHLACIVSYSQPLSKLVQHLSFRSHSSVCTASKKDCVAVFLSCSSPQAIQHAIARQLCSP